MASRSMSREDIAKQYENYSIYVMLSSRGANPGFHWGIFIPTKTPDGHLWHATNREGGWKLDQRPSENVPYSMSLVLAHKIGAVNNTNWQTCIDTLNGIPAGPHPSPNTGETFSCRTWVKDAIIALEKAGIISLDGDISAVEVMLINEASKYKKYVEEGDNGVKVKNSSS
ncbi:hypothetical protein GTR04_0992 [Trichophyton interdigitale]|uniref:Uncharacterized protein n=1 Tax=Trichophyton interdigitale TaxID=101480 RepID=A0A9P5CVZ1_9EURO|nr:hypothetical protein GY632_1925 [Trichophyton interdigitale]KAG5209600.1 hypothetical protein GY631_5634 [Trichophyton interdigitale]KAG8211670.1 hypothetical protein GTR04_0992 [Trichophyton interdigitale]